jgi:hypothetical protein
MSGQGGEHSRGRFVPSLALLLVTLAYIAVAMRYRPDARAMPLLAGSLAAVLLALDLISLTSGRIGALLTQWLSPERDAPIGAYPRMRQAMALAWVIGLTVLSLVVGVLPGVVLYVVGSMRFFGRRSWLSSSVTAVLLAGFIWALFTYTLQISLYPGWIAQYLAGRAP